MRDALKPRLLLLLVLMSVMALFLAACSSDDEEHEGPELTDEMHDAAHDLEKYKDVSAAIADGYIATEECVASPAGAMGMHYVNPAYAQTPEIDLAKPEVLMYLPDGDGLKLGGAEWMLAVGPPGSPIPDSPPPAPVLFGETFEGVMEGHGPDAPPHYDLHVWLFEANPDGVFVGMNPAASCEA